MCNRRYLFLKSKNKKLRIELTSLSKFTIMEARNQQVIYKSEKGVKKQENQDNLLIISESWYNIYAVFDGVGSAENSRQGTEIAKDYILRNHKHYIKNNEIHVDTMMYECNEHILHKNINEAYTTYSIAIIFKDYPQHMVYSTMGDTRIYTVTNQYIEQVSIDDRLGSHKNIITKCLGMDHLEESDFTQYLIEVINKDCILICSDGFYSFLENDRMNFFEVLNKKNIETVKHNLDSKISNKNIDDSTYVFIR